MRDDDLLSSEILWFSCAVRAVQRPSSISGVVMLLQTGGVCLVVISIPVSLFSCLSMRC